MPRKTYFAAGGYWDDGKVHVRPDSAAAYRLPLYLNEREHSPTGFAWGYGGSGPAQLAWALLRDHGLSIRETQPLYMMFKFNVVANLPQNQGWELTSDQIEEAVQKIRNQRMGVE
jgi:hypothetical protein